MIPSTSLQATYANAGVVVWGDISAAGSVAVIQGSNAAELMLASGTLNFVYSGTGITYDIFKNGIDHNQVASLAVVSGDTIYMEATAGGMASPEMRTGSIVVSGLYSDTIVVDLERT